MVANAQEQHPASGEEAVMPTLNDVLRAVSATTGLPFEDLRLYGLELHAAGKLPGLEAPATSMATATLVVGLCAPRPEDAPAVVDAAAQLPMRSLITLRDLGGIISGAISSAVAPPPVVALPPPSGGGMFSHPALKERKRTAESVLPKLEALKVDRWKYLDGVADSGEHIGPYADQWAELFGGDGVTISIQDGLGVALKAIKELSGRVRALESARAEPSR